ncbi:uncharacterized protein LOC105261681 [Musca domestica]|uniref:Uncharacterized protein LOC105261681 n=1 Tax=Musca domestica TaxID=7370 RepID=A0A1I8NL47_MUSDO|nr:uncharacterized protein LOC105261681 [Musca domestica]
MKLFFHLAVVAFFLCVVVARANATEDPKILNQNYYRHLMENLDKGKSPCSKFYPYVCAKWIESNKENKDTYDSIQQLMNYEANMEIIEYLEKTPVADMPDHVKIVKDFYESCTKSKELKLKEFMHHIEKEDNMKWALLTPLENKDVVFDWPSTMAIFRKYGFNDFLVEQWNGPKSIFKYIKKSNMKHLRKNLRLPEGTMDFMDLWSLIDDFEDKYNEVEVQKPEERLYKFKDLPYAWFKKYLTTLMEPHHLDDNMEINIYNIVCLEDLDKLLRDYDAAFLCRYLEVRFLLYLEEVDIPGNANECMTQAKMIFTMATDWIYKELHPEVLQEIPRLDQMFENLIRNVNSTLQMAAKPTIVPLEFFEKLETMKLQVGQLPLENSEEILKSNYENMKLDLQDYPGIYLKMLQFYFETQMKVAATTPSASVEKLYKTPTYSLQSWDFRPTYEAETNRLILPFAAMRPPFYHVAYDDIFKVSSMGSILTANIFGPLYYMEGLPNSDIDILSESMALYSTYEIYFSSLQPEELSRYESMFNMTSLQELKQLFYINALHYSCELDDDDEDILNLHVINMSGFNEAFECNVNKFLKQLS